MNSSDTETARPFVEFKDVWLAYNEELLQANHFAVEAIDLTVKRGEFIAIVGPSGCGKSTFMKLTTGLKMPSIGRITVDGERVTGPLKISGMAFQSSSLLPWRTTLDNVLLPLEIVEPHRSQFKKKRKEYEARAIALLAKVGLAGYERKFPWQLSGGMQQRASICRALIHEPKMLLLDEPFGALDALTRAHLQDSMMEIQATLGNTVIMITHDVDEAVLLSDRIVMMSNGPAANVGDIVTVNLPRPRNRVAMAESVEYMRCRKAVLSFLYERHGRKEASVPVADEEVQPARGNIVELKKVPAKEAA